MNDNTHEEPDFSGDDFEKDKEILRLRKGTLLDWEMIDECAAALRASLNVEECELDDIGDFVMYDNLKAMSIAAHNRMENGRELLVFMAGYSSEYPTARSRNRGENVYVFGRIALSKKYPKTYCCKETIREKLMDLLMKRETDFPEHRKFSNRFHVLTEDPARLTELFRFAPLDELVRFPDLELEIQGGYCFYRHSTEPVSPAEIEKHVELTKVLLQIFR